MKRLNIIFMGTPTFATPTLSSIIETNKHNVVGVITAPDKKKGRGQKQFSSPVKQLALLHNIPVLQPTNLKNESFIAELKNLKADLQVVVAFRMLPEIVWDMPPLGTINLHASLLPQYRGAAPIHWAIINGEKNTGLTTFFLQHAIDTGNIIEQEKIEISDLDTTGTLHDEMSIKGAQLVNSSIDKIIDGDYITKEQPENIILKKAPKIHTADCKIEWNAPAFKVRNFIRGLSPNPGAWSEIFGFKAKFYCVELLNDTTLIPKKLTVGEIWSDQKKHLVIQTKDAPLLIKEIQKEGKRKLQIEDFLKGVKI